MFINALKRSVIFLEIGKTSYVTVQEAKTSENADLRKRYKYVCDALNGREPAEPAPPTE